jgi:hypothetical protein
MLKRRIKAELGFLALDKKLLTEGLLTQLQQDEL